MRVKLIAAFILGLALGNADAQTASTIAPAIKKPSDPNSLSWRKNKRKAKKLLKKGDNEAAAPYLAAGAQKKPSKVYFAENLGRVDLLLRDYKGANQWYGGLVGKDSLKHKKPAYIFQYALTQKYLGQYEAAMANFAKYRKKEKDNDAVAEMKRRATREIEGCQKGIFFRDSVPNPAFKVKHLDASINQPLMDFSPKLKDNALYFSSVRSEQSFARIYKSMKQGKNWSNGEEISDNVNVPGTNVGNPSFTPDGNTMYYTQCEPKAKEKAKCKIYMSTLANGVWTKGTSVGLLVNDPLFDNTQPAVGLNKDGETVLYFVSDRNPGKGRDIFYAKINPDGTAGKPRSAGPAINSKGDEMSPFFDFKSKTLYFSSNGLVNIGGMDVFKSTFDANGEWTDPENLGMPINSSADDMDFSINDKGTFGFVVSNRPGGFSLKSETCCDDIYQVETTKLFLAAKGNVYEEKEGARALAEHGLVMLYDDKNGTELGSYNLINGGFFFDLQPRVNYKLITRKDGYYDAVSMFNTNSNTDNDTMQFDLFLKKKAVQENPLIGRTIGRIYYDYDQAKLRPDSRDSLRKIMDIMNQFPNTIIEVGAHTDGKGTEEYNIALSQRRADAAMNYYIYEKKVNRDRLVAKAYGTSQPVASNTTPDGKDNPAGRALNRRTEFKIIGELKPKEDAKGTAATTVAGTPNATTKDQPAARVVKKDMTGKVTAPPVAPAAAAKPASSSIAPGVISGKVYMEKGGKRTLAGQSAVFLTTSEGGFLQKVFYVKGDGSYNFDESHVATDTFKLIARKYTSESSEVILLPRDIKDAHGPVDLILHSK
jgi:OOP family OmpA-OmpF porin